MKKGDEVAIQEHTEDAGLISITGMIEDIDEDGWILVLLHRPLFTDLGEKWRVVRNLDDANVRVLVNNLDWRQCGF